MIILITFFPKQFLLEFSFKVSQFVSTFFADFYFSAMFRWRLFWNGYRYEEKYVFFYNNLMMKWFSQNRILLQIAFKFRNLLGIFLLLQFSNRPILEQCYIPRGITIICIQLTSSVKLAPPLYELIFNNNCSERWLALYPFPSPCT